MAQEPATSENRLLAALGYPIGLIAIIVLLTDMKQNRFMRHHAVQSLAFIIASIVVIVGVSVLISILASISRVFVFFVFLTPVLSLSVLILTVVFAFRAYQGQMFEIPILSRYTRKYLP